MWGTATIEPSISSQPTEGYEYTYLCSIVLRDGIVGTPNLVWVGPDGDPIVSASNMTVERAETVEGKTSLLLSFLPLSSTHGGNYSCEASVLVPHVNVTRFKVVKKTLIVTSKSYDLANYMRHHVLVVFICPCVCMNQNFGSFNT